jgi:uncharacterized RDD family membrane protein YckC
MTSTLWEVPQVRFGAGHGSVLVTVAAVTVLGLAPHPALLVVGAVMAGWTTRLSLIPAVALGAVAWAYYTGFVVNQYGQLTFAAGDLARLGLLLAVAAAAHWCR